MIKELKIICDDNIKNILWLNKDGDIIFAIK
jgi:hypothetical protein